MRFPGAAVVGDEARTHFGQPLSLRSYIIVPSVTGLALSLVWPRVGAAALVRVGPTPNPFDVVAVSLLLVAMYLGARHGSEDYTPGAGTRVRDLVRFTPVTPPGIVAGKAVFGLGHTLFLVLLGAPFLLAALSVGGITASQAVAALGVVAAAGLCARMLGLLVLVVVRSGPLARDIVILPLIAVGLVLTLLFLPVSCPIDAVLGRTPRQAWTSVGISLTVGAVFAAAAALALRITGRHDG